MWWGACVLISVVVIGGLAIAFRIPSPGSGKEKEL